MSVAAKSVYVKTNILTQCKISALFVVSSCIEYIDFYDVKFNAKCLFCIFVSMKNMPNHKLRHEGFYMCMLCVALVLNSLSHKYPILIQEWT